MAFHIGDRVRLNESTDVDGTTVSTVVDGEIVDENDTQEDYWFVAFELEFRDRVETVATWVHGEDLHKI